MVQHRRLSLFLLNSSPLSLSLSLSLLSLNSALSAHRSGLLDSSMEPSLRYHVTHIEGLVVIVVVVDFVGLGRQLGVAARRDVGLVYEALLGVGHVRRGAARRLLLPRPRCFTR